MRIKTHIVHKCKTVIITKKIITLEINTCEIAFMFNLVLL